MRTLGVAIVLVFRLATDAAAQGIRGVPFFVFGEKYALSGAQPDEVFERALAQTIEEL